MKNNLYEYDIMFTDNAYIISSNIITFFNFNNK